MAEKIVINESYLNARKEQFKRYDEEAYARLYPFNWGGGTQANLSVALRMPTGKEGFTPGEDLYAAADLVRANFLTRMKQFKDQSMYLYTGLEEFLADQEEIQDLNKVTATDFGDYVEETTSGLGTTT